MRAIFLLFAIVIIAISSISAQDYQDYADGYEQDNMYENYAMKQQEKTDGGGGWVLQFICDCRHILCFIFVLY